MMQIGRAVCHVKMRSFSGFTPAHSGGTGQSSSAVTGAAAGVSEPLRETRHVSA